MLPKVGLKWKMSVQNLIEIHEVTNVSIVLNAIPTQDMRPLHLRLIS